MFTLTIEDSNGQLANQFSFDHGSYVIGRLEDSDIVLPSSSVSRQHARVFVENGRCYIEDLGSANGVIVDGQRVVSQRDLGTASQIRVGDFYLYLEYKRAAQQLSNQNVMSTLFISSGTDHDKLVRIGDSFAGEEFSLSELSNTIGRTDENFILLSDASISREHAIIQRIGDDYTVVDNGSSNGTKLNKKPLRGTQPLRRGDIVQFGNLQFVFVNGDAKVDPRDYAGSSKKSSTNVTLYVSLAILGLVGIAVGAMAVLGMFSLKESKKGAPEAQIASPAELLEAKIEALLDATDKQMQQRNWDGAIATIDELLALAPSHAPAQDFKERARFEKAGAELLDRAEQLSEQGRHLDAQRILVQIPADTVAYESAQSTLGHVNKTLAYNLKSEATRLFNDRRTRDHSEAHKKVVEALVLVPDDGEALELVAKIEADLTKKKVVFEPYARR
ncbi:MAG: FHA domain-containing protein [Bradymonadaceae bacterium]|nr:FHA domain-containing protein [Lujinxingiaceae bacterium]